MKIRIELTEKEIRNLAMAVKPVYEIDGLEEREVEGDRNMKKLIERVCSDDNNIVVGHGYKGIIGSNAVKFEFDSRAVEMAAQYFAKTLRRFNPLINATIRFVKSMKELVGITGETLRSDAEEFTKKYNDAFPVEREWKLVTVEQAHAACLYERIDGSTEWTNIQWTTGWQKVDDVMDVMDLHPSYRFFADEESAKAAFRAFLQGNAQQDQQDQTESSSDSDVNGWDYV